MFVLNSLICLAILTLVLGKKLYNIALFYSMVIFVWSFILILRLHPNTANFIGSNVWDVTIFNFVLTYSIALDGLSVLFIILSTFLIIICVLSSKTIKYRCKLFFILLFLIELALVNVFSVMEIIFFYIFFEAVLIPVFMIIGIYGSRQEKISAAYQFFLYTLIGSLFMLLSLLYMLSIVGSTNLWILKAHEFSSDLEKLFWLSFFFSFAVKIPMFPFHLWLPKAHVEAPTAGSILLAGILLKLGGYGFLRFCLFLFPSASQYFRPLIIVLALLGILYSSFTILRQVDLKRIIAYSSIAHMNFVILGCFTGNTLSLMGAILLMIAHGLVSAALFACVGYLYDRYKTRNLFYYRGLGTIMPMYTILFFILMLTNIGFPPTLNFVSEFLILCGIMESNMTTALISIFGLFFAGIAGFWVFTHIFFGNYAYTEKNNRIPYFYDLTRREFYSILPLVLLAILFGFVPNTLMGFISFEFATWGI